MDDNSKSPENTLKQQIETLVEDANNVLNSAAISSSKTAQSVKGRLKDTINETRDAVRSARDSVVMVRINKTSLSRIDELVEAKIVRSRSEAAAFLIDKGIESKQDLFDIMAEKLEQIRQTRDELSHLLEDDKL
ncbi:MAG: DUF883 family protein [Chloroflexota bacterium]|nr:DUF883 family protein [Chloroflexota bacterium]|tara:strand:- start:102 stop:503 length:402 start_codon:yes stop_codon:yes gene_type:complete